MKENVVAAVVVIAVIGVSVGGYWGYHIWDQGRSAQTSNNQTTAYADSPPTTESTPQNTTNQQNATQNTPQSQVLSNSTSTANTTNTTNNASTDNSNTATLKPAEFGMYNKYASSTTALYVDIATGTGAEAAAGKKVSVNYIGWLTNGTIFDQNQDASKPFSFTIGAGNVIRGWEQTVFGMKVGGERLLIIPPSVGYGNTANGPIPANSVLIFRVKLLGVE